MTNETNANSTQITLKIFGQNGCNPCRIIKTVIEGEREDIEELGVTIEHVDLTRGARADRDELIEKYGIMGTPVTIIEKGSEVVSRFNSLFNMTELYETLEYAQTL